MYTAYEFLEQRFDLKNRVLGSLLFLIQRGLAAGFTILAPALIISVILGWDFRLTIFMIGGLVILYTAAGGTEAVNKTHLLQMMIVTAGMGAAFFMIFRRLPPDISFSSAVHVAGKLGKLNVVNFAFNWKDRYNFWSGLIGGAFVALSYFGTDQSQVQRYLSGRSVAQSRMGLLANGVFKVPMQFVILFIGAMIFVFYQFVTPPLFFNPVETAQVKSGSYAASLHEARNGLRSPERREAGPAQANAGGHRYPATTRTWPTPWKSSGRRENRNPASGGRPSALSRKAIPWPRRTTRITSS